VEILARAAAVTVRHVGARPTLKPAAMVFHGAARALRVRVQDALDVTGAAESTAHRWARALPDDTLRAALLCLGDERLRNPADMPTLSPLWIGSKLSK